MMLASVFNDFSLILLLDSSCLWLKRGKGICNYSSLVYRRSWLSSSCWWIDMCHIHFFYYRAPDSFCWNNREGTHMLPASLLAFELCHREQFDRFKKVLPHPTRTLEHLHFQEPGPWLILAATIPTILWPSGSTRLEEEEAPPFTFWHAGLL